MKNKIQADTLRSLAFGSISGSYAAVGTALTVRAKIICITNNTEGDMIFSTDGSTDHLYVPAGSFKLFDVSTNYRAVNQDECVFPIGTQFYVKQDTAPVSGSVYIEILYAS